MSDQITETKIVGDGKYTYEFIPNWGNFPDKVYNNGIAVDSQDRVYVVSLGIGEYKNVKPGPLMYVMDKSGEFIESWGTGASNHAHGLNIVNDQVFLTDKYDSICLRYTLDGKILQMLGQRGMHSDTGCESSGAFVPRAAGPFNHPDDFTQAPWGDLYVADGTHNTRIHRFDSGGHLIQSWGQWGDGPGHFKSPHAVLPMPDGRLIVSDRMNHRVQIFSSLGKFLGMWDKDLQWPSKVLPTHEGDFVVCEDPGNQKARGDSEDRSEAKAARPSGIRVLDGQGELITHLDVGRTHLMAMDSVGNIYTATHRAVHKLRKIQPA